MRGARDVRYCHLEDLNDTEIYPMTLQEWWWLVGTISAAVSAAAILGAAGKYFWTRDNKSGETLLTLEETFRNFHRSWKLGKSRMPPITRAVETDGDEFDRRGLASAIQKGIDGRHAERDERERAWIPRLDELLRFLMIVAAMQKNRLLKKRAMWDAYHYWFRTITNDPLLRTYVGLHFPVLDRFLTSNHKELQRYEEFHDGTGTAAVAKLHSRIARKASHPMRRH